MILVTALRILLVAGLAYLAIVFLVQRSVVFPGRYVEPPRSTPLEPDGVVQIWLQEPQSRVEAWYLPSSRERTRANLIFAHGNGELIDDWLPAMRMLADGGFAVLLVEYPGYGHSTGRPSRSAIAPAFEEAFDWLAADPRAGGAPIVAWGRSLGGGAAADLAGRRPVDALILQSTFTSTSAMARRSFVPGFLVRDRFDNVEALRRYDGPVLIMHGTSDEVIPVGHGRHLAEVREGTPLVELDCGHNDCGRVWADILGHVTTFLEDRLGSRSVPLGRP